MDTKIKPMLFYYKSADINDCGYKKFLDNIFNVNIEIYPILEHREMYDHKDIPEYFPETDIKMPDLCWCEIPDENNPWPQLYMHTPNGYVFVAAGENLLDINLENIHKTFGKNFVGNGFFI